MPREQTIRILRTTRLALDTQKIANNLLEGEPYLVTDEGSLVIGTGINSYTNIVNSGNVIQSGLTMTTDKLLGNTSGSNGNIQEISVVGATLSGSTLTIPSSVQLTDERVVETMTILTPSVGVAGVQTLDLSIGRAFKIDCATNSPTSLSIELSNIPTGNKLVSITLIFITGADTLPIVTWPVGVADPTLVLSQTTWYTLSTDDNGITTRLFSLGTF